MFTRALITASVLTACATTLSAAEEYNFNFNQDVTRNDCYAMEVRIDKYLALADEALKKDDDTTSDSFAAGQAYASVAADFARVFTKFCEDG